jgi:hypothetical protein
MLEKERFACHFGIDTYINAILSALFLVGAHGSALFLEYHGAHCHARLRLFGY